MREEPGKDRFRCVYNALGGGDNDFGRAGVIVHMSFGGFSMGGGMRAPGAARLGAGAQRLIHDLLDGPCTTAALSAATETAIDLPGGPGRTRAGHRLADVVVGKDVAGTDDHQMKARSQSL